MSNAHILAAAALLGITAPILVFMDEVESLMPVAPSHSHKLCANQSKLTRCNRAPEHGHIFCKSCRLELGGYDRYNRPAPQSA